MEYFALAPDWAGVVVDVPGWVMMVTGQSVVLYSRLHLVMQNQKVLKAVLMMIIVDGVLVSICISACLKLLLHHLHFYLHVQISHKII